MRASSSIRGALLVGPVRVAIGYSPERGRRFDFSSQAVVVKWGQVYVRDGSPIKTPPDLTGKKLAVMRGDIYFSPTELRLVAPKGRGRE